MTDHEGLDAENRYDYSFFKLYVRWVVNAMPHVL